LGGAKALYHSAKIESGKGGKKWGLSIKKVKR